MKEANYRANSAGRALRRQRSDLLAVIVPDVRNPFFLRFVESFEEVAHANGYSVVLCNSQEDLSLERSAIDSVIAHRVSGALIAAVSASKSRLAAFQLAGIPVVTIDRRVDGFTGDSVSVDNALIGRMAAEHLLERGRTRPVVLSHDGDLSPLRERERGFAGAVAQAGVPLAEAAIVHLAFRDGSNEARIAELLSSRPEIDAIFATTNTLTSVAYTALRAAGLAIGRQVALVGVDDDRWNVMVDPPVTVVEQPAEQLGRWAGQLLVGRADGQDMESARVLLDPVLRVRGSSRPG